MDLKQVSNSSDQGEVFLVLVDYNNFRDISNQLTSQLLEKFDEGIFFTTDRSYTEVLDELEYMGTDLESLYFIDVISKKRGITKENEKVELVDAPTAFNDINLAFSKFYQQDEKEKFVLMDSFTSYLLYGNLKPLGNFVKKMTDKAKKYGSKFYIMAMKTQIDDEIIGKLMSFCDKKYDFSEK